MNPLLHTWFHGTRSRYSYKWSVASREPMQQGINNSHHFGPLAQAEDVPAYLMHSYFVQLKKRHDSGCIFKPERGLSKMLYFLNPNGVTLIHISTIKITRCPVKGITSKSNLTQVKPIRPEKSPLAQPILFDPIIQINVSSEVFHHYSPHRQYASVQWDHWRRKRLWMMALSTATACLSFCSDLGRHWYLRKRLLNPFS